MISEDTKEEAPKTEDVSPAQDSKEVATSTDAALAATGEETTEDLAGQRRWMVVCLALLIVVGAFFGYRRWLRPGRRQPWLVGEGANSGLGSPTSPPTQAPPANDAVLALLTPLREGSTIANGRVTRISGVHNGVVYVSVLAGSQNFVLTISRAEADLNSMRAGPYALDLISGPPGPVAMRLSQSVLQVLQTNVRVPVPAGMTVH